MDYAHACECRFPFVLFNISVASSVIDIACRSALKDLQHTCPFGNTHDGGEICYTFERDASVRRGVCVVVRQETFLPQFYVGLDIKRRNRPRSCQRSFPIFPAITREGGRLDRNKKSKQRTHGAPI